MYRNSGIVNGSVEWLSASPQVFQLGLSKVLVVLERIDDQFALGVLESDRRCKGFYLAFASGLSSEQTFIGDCPGVRVGDLKAGFKCTHCENLQMIDAWMIDME